MSRVLVAKNIPGATSTYYIYDGPNLVSQGGTASTSRQYYLDDGIGNILAVVDSTGNTVQAYSVDPYGNQVTGSNTSNFKYENQQTDSETGLYYLRARTYDPTLGSFTSRDPISGTLKNPQSQDGYNYANDNPINLSDPSGMFGLSDVRNFFTGIWNGVSTYFTPQPCTYVSGGGGPGLSPEYPNFSDPSQSPGQGWEWRGPGAVGSGQGAWYNPVTQQSIRNDLLHGPPIEPHFDYKGPGGSFRLFVGDPIPVTGGIILY